MTLRSMQDRTRNLATSLVALSIILAISTAVVAQEQLSGLITFTPEISFGESEGPGELLIPIDIAVGPDRSLFVLDYGTMMVKSFDPDGVFIDTIGRQGEGPGEFEKARNIVARSDGTLCVFDLTLGRFSVFDTHGTIGQTVRFQGSSRSLHALPDGSVLGHFRSPDFGWVENGMQHKILLFGSELTDPVEIYVERLLTHQVIAEDKYSSTNVQRPFPPRLLLTSLPNGEFALATNTRDTLYWYDAQGALIRQIHCEVDAIDVDDAQQRQYIVDESNGDPGLESRLRDRITFPSNIPPLVGLHCGPSGLLLVEIASQKGIASYNVYDSQGVFLGRVSGTPIPGRVAFRDGYRFQFIDVSDDSPAHVVRHRIEISWLQGSR